MRDAPQRASIPAPVIAACGYFLPRLMFLRSRYAPQVHWGDVTLALAGLPTDNLDLGSQGFWDGWRERWVEQAERHLAVADASSTVAGRAGAYGSAAACYHWAEFMDFGDATRKLALRSRVRECFGHSLADSDLEIEAGTVPAARPDAPVPYWLLRPPAHRRRPGPLPCVLLCNGLDSMTEVEVLALAERYLDRGIAAVLFEGPGQGIQVGQTPLRVDMEVVVEALVDHLADDTRIAADRLAFAGISFGGYVALRVARHLGSRLRCVVNYSGGPAVRPYDGLPRRLKDDFRFVLTAGGPAVELPARLKDLALDLDTAVDTDVLSIHGGLDDIFPVEALAELDRAWGSRHELRVHPAEAHVCLNVIDTCALEAADWVAERLVDRR